jgi:uncharacterized protein (TIGR03435 family)
MKVRSSKLEVRSKFKLLPDLLRTSHFALPTFFVALAAALAAQAPTFEAASIKLHVASGPPRPSVSAIPASGRFTATAVTVRDIILAAYRLQRFELIDTDSPVLNQRIDIVAKAAPSTSVVEMQRMLEPLLAERFKLLIHRENRELDAQVIVRARPDRLGPKLTRSTADCSALGVTNSFAREGVIPTSPDDPRCGILPGGIGRIVVRGMEMPGILAFIFTSPRPAIVDQTGLEGRWDVDVTYTPEAFTPAALARRNTTAPDGVNPDGPPLITALEDQLGLKVEARRATVSVVVIDRIEPLIPD